MPSTRSEATMTSGANKFWQGIEQSNDICIGFIAPVCLGVWWSVTVCNTQSVVELKTQFVLANCLISTSGSTYCEGLYGIFTRQIAGSLKLRLQTNVKLTTSWRRHMHDAVRLHSDCFERCRGELTASAKLAELIQRCFIREIKYKLIVSLNTTDSC